MRYDVEVHFVIEAEGVLEAFAYVDDVTQQMVLVDEDGNVAEFRPELQQPQHGSARPVGIHPVGDVEQLADDAT